MASTNQTQPPAISVEAAIRRGLLYVNGPVVLLMFAPMLLSLALFNRMTRAFGSDTYAFITFCVIFVVGFVLAWLWWSYAVPRWRLWAYERVEDIAALKVRAVQVGLTWPDGHVFERTEFKSATAAKRQQELEGRAKNDA
jgi:hypothetical protein